MEEQEALIQILMLMELMADQVVVQLDLIIPVDLLMVVQEILLQLVHLKEIMEEQEVEVIHFIMEEVVVGLL